MENWDNWIFLLFGILLGIPASIFANLVTPSVDTYLKNRSLSAKERKKLILFTRYRDVKKGKKNPVFSTEATPYSWLLVYPALYGVYVTSSAYDLSSSALWLTLHILYLIVMTYYFIRLFQDFTIFWDYKHFDRYKGRVIKKLKKLGGNPEGLDKIDREIEAEKQGG
jgi:hypothetical protein